MMYAVCKAKNEQAHNEINPVFNLENWEIQRYIKCRKNAARKTRDKIFKDIYDELLTFLPKCKTRLWNFPVGDGLYERTSGVYVTVYENKSIKVVDTGRDYDCVCFVENKTDTPLRVETLTDDENCDIYEDVDPKYNNGYRFTVKPNNWVGILAESYCWDVMNRLINGDFKLMEA